MPQGFHPDYIASFFMNPRIKQLTIAAALIAAEIDRLMAVQDLLNKTKESGIPGNE